MRPHVGQRAAIRRIASRPADGPWTDLIFSPVVVYGHVPAIKIARQRLPALEAIVQRLRSCRTCRHQHTLRHHPFVKGIAHRFGAALPKPVSRFDIKRRGITFDVIWGGEERQRLISDLTAVIGMQFEELAPRVSCAADFGDTLKEWGLVAAVVITDQLAAPVTQERTGMLTGTASGEVVDHCTQVTELRRRIRSQVGPMCPALAGAEHLHWGFVRVQDKSALCLIKPAAQQIRVKPMFQRDRCN